MNEIGVKSESINDLIPMVMLLNVFLLESLFFCPRQIATHFLRNPSNSVTWFTVNANTFQHAFVRRFIK